MCSVILHNLLQRIAPITQTPTCCKAEATLGKLVRIITGTGCCHRNFRKVKANNWCNVTISGIKHSLMNTFSTKKPVAIRHFWKGCWSEMLSPVFVPMWHETHVSQLLDCHACMFTSRVVTFNMWCDGDEILERECGTSRDWNREEIKSWVQIQCFPV